MINSDAFDRILLQPIKLGYNQLYIVSGYASAAMAFHHLSELKTHGIDINIKLIIGMCPIDGISLTNHSGFIKIMAEDFSEQFECSYRTSNPPVHSKVYLWLKNGKPKCAFMGSANYTQIAFNSSRQLESMVECSPKAALAYYESLIDKSIYCTHPDSEDIIQIYNDRFVRRARVTERIEEDLPLFQPNIESLESVRVSLLDRNGNMQKRAGLNWGQRPGREPNQAYIQLRPEVYWSDFFPSRSIHFTVITDDLKPLICTRAQKNKVGAAIETPHNNSLIGEYFRNRLGLANGAPVKKQDLVNYGRTYVTFYKIDDENYYMDFSV